MVADYAICLARTDPDAQKRAGITYFLLNMRQPGIDVRPLRTISGEEEFAETFIDGPGCPTAMFWARSTTAGDWPTPP